jgi:hypothetical protein
MTLPDFPKSRHCFRLSGLQKYAHLSLHVAILLMNLPSNRLARSWRQMSSRRSARGVQIGNFYVTSWEFDVLFEVYCIFWRKKFFWQSFYASIWIFIQSSTGSLLSISHGSCLRGRGKYWIFIFLLLTHWGHRWAICSIDDSFINFWSPAGVL